MTDLTPIPVKDVSHALRVVQMAREGGLSASYHPSGGDTIKRYIPVTHTVWVIGTPAQIREFRNLVIKENAHVQ